VSNNEKTNIFAGSALMTAVSQLRENITELKTGVTELTTYSRQNDATGNLSTKISILISIFYSVHRPEFHFKLFFSVFLTKTTISCLCESYQCYSRF